MALITGRLLHEVATLNKTNQNALQLATPAMRTTRLFRVGRDLLKARPRQILGPAASLSVRRNKSGLRHLQRSPRRFYRHGLLQSSAQLPIPFPVPVPCIERCAFGAVKAWTAFMIATNEIESRHRVDLDATIKTLADTGRDMNAKYKETSEAGLAQNLTIC